MRAEILSIGTELLLGSILNSNQQYLCQQMAGLGLDVYRLGTVGDNPARIASALGEAFLRSDLVITTGGLGPTEDDVTLKSAEAALGLRLVRHAPTWRAILRVLQNKRRKMTPAVARQAFVPAGSRVFPNRFGTAPGILVSFKQAGRDKYLVLLPGPPRELIPMFEGYCAPALKKLCGARPPVLLVRSLKFSSVPEAEIAAKVGDLLRASPPLTLGIYARPGEVELKIMSKYPSRARAAQGLDRMEREIRRRFPHEIILIDAETLEERLGRLCLKRKRTLAAAESCTGGLLGSLITDVPGSSKYFLGSVTAYDDSVKVKRLSVDRDLIRRHGTVSHETAQAMAEGVRKLFGADYGVSVTGIAGPSGARPGKPVGLVFIAVAGTSGVMSWRYHFIGERKDVKLKAARSALLNLVRRLGFKESCRGQKKKEEPHGYIAV